MTTIINGLKHILSLTILLFTIQYGSAQAVGTPYIIPTQDIPFSFLTGGTQSESPGAVTQTSDGGYITIGSTNSSATGDITETNRGWSDILVVKYDQYGKREWNRIYGGDQYEYGYSIKQTTDGGYVFVGVTTSSGTGDVMTAPANHGQGDIWVVKLTVTGAISWQKVFGGITPVTTTGQEYGNIIHQTPDGGYIIGGRTRSSASGDVTSTRPLGAFDFWVLKLTSTGALTWQQAYGTPTGGTGEDYLYGLEPTSDGTGYIMGGYSTDIANGSFFAVKINLTGGVVWSRTYGSTAIETCYSLAVTSDGGAIMAGYSAGSANGDVTSANHGGEDMWVIKLNSAGAIQWQRLLGGAGNERAHSVIQTADGGYMVAGNSSSSASGDVTDTNKGETDVCVFKLSSTGATQWHRLYGGPARDGYVVTSSTMVNLNPVRIQQAADGDYIIASTCGSTNSGDVTDTNNGTGGNSNTDQWLFKFDQSGNIVWVPDVGQKD